jgi:hypothetical protein
MNENDEHKQNTTPIKKKRLCSQENAKKSKHSKERSKMITLDDLHSMVEEKLKIAFVQQSELKYFVLLTFVFCRLTKPQRERLKSREEVIAKYRDDVTKLESAENALNKRHEQLLEELLLVEKSLRGVHFFLTFISLSI